MATGTWHGDDLARSASAAHTAAGRRWSYLAATAAGGGWALAVGGGRATGIAVAAIALSGATVETALVAIRRDAADRAADQLIEQGFPVSGRDDAVAGSVRRRVEQLTAPCRRRQLAASVRRQLQQERMLAARRTRGMRPAPPIRGLLAHHRLVCEIATMVERPGADPRACVLLTRILTSPPGHPASPGDPHGTRQLAASLARIHAPLATGADGRAGADGYSHAWCGGDGAPSVGR